MNLNDQNSAEQAQPGQRPTPSTPQDERKEVLALLEKLGRDMDAAMNSRNAVEFNRLCQQRKTLLTRLLDSGPLSGVSADVIGTLEEDSKRWISQGQALLDAIRAEIERLQPQKSTARRITNGYGRIPPTGRFFLGPG